MGGRYHAARRRREGIIRSTFFVAAALAIVISVAIVLSLLGDTITFLRGIDPMALLADTWQPRNAEYGLATIISGTLVIAVIATDNVRAIVAEKRVTICAAANRIVAQASVNDVVAGAAVVGDAHVERVGLVQIRADVCLTVSVVLHCIARLEMVPNPEADHVPGRIHAHARIK